MIKVEYNNDLNVMDIEFMGDELTILNEFSALVFKLHETASRHIGKDESKKALKMAFKNGLKLEMNDKHELKLKKDGKNE